MAAFRIVSVLDIIIMSWVSRSRHSHEIAPQSECFNFRIRGRSSILALVMWAPAAIASPIAYDFTGTVNSATGIFAGQGTVVTGSFSFDDGLIDSQLASNTSDFFRNDTPVANQPLTGVFSAVLTVGGITVSDVASNPTSADAWLELVDSSSEDRIKFRLPRNSGPEPSFILMGRDFSGFGAPDAVASGSGNLTGTIAGAISILDGLNLSLFSQTAAQSSWQQYDSSGVLQGSVSFAWTGITRAATAPEPASIALLGLGLLVGVRFRRTNSAC